MNSREVKAYLEDLINIVVLTTVLSRHKFYFQTVHAKHVQVDRYQIKITKSVLVVQTLQSSTHKNVQFVLNIDKVLVEHVKNAQLDLFKTTMVTVVLPL
jgi:hypothetical protein